jgi:hypothetical protein
MSRLEGSAGLSAGLEAHVEGIAPDSCVTLQVIVSVHDSHG